MPSGVMNYGTRMTVEMKPGTNQTTSPSKAMNANANRHQVVRLNPSGHGAERSIMRQSSVLSTSQSTLQYCSARLALCRATGYRMGTMFGV